MELHIHIHNHVDLPQLSSLEGVLRKGFTSMSEATDRLTQAVTDTMNDLTSVLDTEITQITDALNAANGDPALVDLQTQRLLAFRDTFNQRVANIIPDPPPVP